MNKVKNMEPINFKERYDIFDDFIEEKISKKKIMDENVLYGLYSVRGLISGLLPRLNILPENKTIWFKKIMKQFKNSMYKIPKLNTDSETIILSSDPRNDELEISKKTGYPLAKMEFKKKYSIKNFINGFKVLFYTIYTSKFLSDLKLLDKNQHRYIFEEILSFYKIYFNIEFKHTKNIITECDVFFEFFPIIMKAKKRNINTIKIDYFISNSHTGESKRIFAKYYWALDFIHRDFYKKFEYNNDVIFNETTGMLNCDNLIKYKDTPLIPKKKKIILYLTSHSMNIDVDNKHIMDLAEFVNHNQNYVLVIKTHPNDPRDYSKMYSKNVKICKKTGDEYFKLAKQADFILCILSSLILQTKHFNDNCFFLRYYSEENEKLYWYSDCWNEYSKYINVINSKNELIEFLRGEKSTSTSKYFIDNVNPCFPNATGKFQEFIGEITK